MQLHPKIIEYKVVSRIGLEELMRMVNGSILDGWQPIGSLRTAGNAGFFQAMVLYEEPIKQAAAVLPSTPISRSEIETISKMSIRPNLMSDEGAEQIRRETERDTLNVVLAAAGTRDAYIAQQLVGRAKDQLMEERKR